MHVAFKISSRKHSTGSFLITFNNPAFIDSSLQQRCSPFDVWDFNAFLGSLTPWCKGEPKTDFVKSVSQKQIFILHQKNLIWSSTLNFIVSWDSYAALLMCSSVQRWFSTIREGERYQQAASKSPSRGRFWVLFGFLCGGEVESNKICRAKINWSVGFLHNTHKYEQQTIFFKIM